MFNVLLSRYSTSAAFKIKYHPSICLPTIMTATMTMTSMMLMMMMMFVQFCLKLTNYIAFQSEWWFSMLFAALSSHYNWIRTSSFPPDDNALHNCVIFASFSFSFSSFPISISTPTLIPPFTFTFNFTPFTVLSLALFLAQWFLFLLHLKFQVLSFQSLILSLQTNASTTTTFYLKDYFTLLYFTLVPNKTAAHFYKTLLFFLVLIAATAIVIVVLAASYC